MPTGCNGPPTEAGWGVPLWDLGVPVAGELHKFIFSDKLGSFPDEWPYGRQKENSNLYHAIKMLLLLLNYCYL